MAVGATGEAPLPGLFAVSRGKGLVPAVVLLHGAGPGSRDAGMGATLPFRDLAYGLAGRDVAVLRYDKRSFAHPEEFAGRAYTVEEEVVQDARAAVEWLRSVPEIDPARIFVLGHSTGGLLAPRIIARAPGIAGLILLAAPMRPLTEVIRSQVEYLTRQDSTQTPPAQRETVLTELARIEALTPDVDPAARVLGAPAAYWLDLHGYDLVATAESLVVPILILQGGRDFQVTEQDFAGWQRALSEREGVTLKKYPDLNHLFIAGLGPSTYAECQRPGHVAEAVVTDIAEWIRAH